MITIYALKMKGIPELFYVGQTHNWSKRIRHHRRTFGKDVRMVTLEVCQESHANTREAAWIANLIREGHGLLNKYKLPPSLKELPKKYSA